MKQIIGALLVLMTFVIGCNSEPSLEGLWIVKSVSVGTEEMTPNARWMRFNPDATQQSGNGWFQHSVGTWSFNNNLLKVENTNGITDSYPPFAVDLKENQMTWNREEDGMEVTVFLERASELPQTYGDEILGLWKLEDAQGNGTYFNSVAGQKDYLFIKWDKRFVIETDSNRFTGVYHVNGHRPRLSLIPSNEELTNTYWDFSFHAPQITLTQRGTDGTVTRTFTRIQEFPN